MSNFFRTPEVSADAIFKMIEVLPNDLKEAVAKRENAFKQVSVLHSGAAGVFDYSLVHSGSNAYEVIRLGGFASCTCKDFEYKRAACKHIAATWPLVCIECFDTPIGTLGQTCSLCSRKTERAFADASALLKPSNEGPVTMIGKIRV